MQIKKEVIIEKLKKEGYKESKSYPGTYTNKKLKSMVIPRDYDTEPTLLKDLTDKPKRAKVIIQKGLK